MSEGFERNGAVEEFKSKMVSNVMWKNDVVAGNWYGADGRLFFGDTRTIELDIHRGGGGGNPVAARRSTGCVGDS